MPSDFRPAFVMTKSFFMSMTVAGIISPGVIFNCEILDSSNCSNSEIVVICYI